MKTIVAYDGRVCNLSDEVYRITDDSSVINYGKGIEVRLISGVDDHTEPGYHFNNEYRTVCRCEAKSAEFVGIKANRLERIRKSSYLTIGDYDSIRKTFLRNEVVVSHGGGGVAHSGIATTIAINGSLEQGGDGKCEHERSVGYLFRITVQGQCTGTVTYFCKQEGLEWNGGELRVSTDGGERIFSLPKLVTKTDTRFITDGGERIFSLPKLVTKTDTMTNGYKPPQVVENKIGPKRGVAPGLNLIDLSKRKGVAPAIK
jgi:hypothetical protein